MTGEIRFTLEWEGDDDLDLHVITPGGFEIFYGNPSDPTTGGFLDVDETSETFVKKVENIVIPSAGGTQVSDYDYFVVRFSTLGDEQDAYTLKAYEDGKLVDTITGEQKDICSCPCPCSNRRRRSTRGLFSFHHFPDQKKEKLGEDYYSFDQHRHLQISQSPTTEPSIEPTIAPTTAAPTIAPTTDTCFCPVP